MGWSGRAPAPDLASDWRRLDERIEGLAGEIETLARQDNGAQLVKQMRLAGCNPVEPPMARDILDYLSITRCLLARLLAPSHKTQMK